MMAFFTTIWTWIKDLLGILLPLGRGWKMPAAVRWTLHLLLLTAVLIGLYYLNDYLKITPIVQTPWAQKLWLPMLFLLLYLILWIGWWIWKLLAFDQETSAYPDIEEAWHEAIDALGKAGMRLSEMPVFLVLGRAEGGVRPLFEAARPQWVVKQTPAANGAPLHVFADRDAVYITCEGASLLGRQAGILALEELREGGNDAAGDEMAGMDATMRPGKKEKKVIDIVRELAGRDTTSIERRALRRASNLPIGPDIMADPAEVERTSDRLAYLCRLIGRNRLPFCPVNGILLVVPLGGTDTDLDAQQTADATKTDLATIRRTMKLECPMFALWSDMEILPGFKEFLARQNARDLGRRLGQRFPLASNLPNDAAMDALEEALYYLCNSFMQDSVYKFFRIETPEKPDSTPLFAGNSRLFLVLDEMRMRAKRLVRILTQAAYKEPGSPLLFGGCYLGATGGPGEQAFVPGLFNRLSDEQNCVTWTNQALVEDASAHSQTWWGYVLLLIVMVMAVGFIAWPFVRPIFGR